MTLKVLCTTILLGLSSAAFAAMPGPQTQPGQPGTQQMPPALSMHQQPMPMNDRAGYRHKTHNMKNRLAWMKKSMMLKPGQSEFSIELAGNATTGYRWYLAGMDSTKLVLTGYQYETDHSGRVGAPGKAVFTFHVLPDLMSVGPKMTMVKFVNMQAWNPDQPGKKLTMLVFGSGDGKGQASTPMTQENAYGMMPPPPPGQDLNQADSNYGRNYQPQTLPTEANAPAAGDNWLSLPEDES